MKLLGFNSWKVYICQDASCSMWRKRWAFLHKDEDAVGFGYELRAGFRKKLFGLYCSGGEVYFLEQGKSINVMSIEWDASVEDLSSTKRRFVLRRDGQTFLSIEFRDFSKSSSDDPDQHFFAEVAHWLSDASLKSSFVRYWTERRNKKTEAARTG